MEKSKVSGWRRALRIAVISVCLLLVLAILVLGFFDIGYRFYEYERWQPAKENMLPDDELLAIIKKGDAITDAEYDIIYKQTGLTRIGIERMLEDETAESILRYRDSFFRDYELRDDEFGLFCNQKGLKRLSKLVPLRNGDILISSATNFSMWKTGHSAMVVNEEKDTIIETYSPEGSELSTGHGFSTRADFIVLRPKLDSKTIDDIVKYTNDNLVGLSYDPTVGVLSRKYQENIQSTQCAHVIWYAFMKFGIDIDSNGGPVVNPQDMANSEYFEVVQVFGFDPDVLWK